MTGPQLIGAHRIPRRERIARRIVACKMSHLAQHDFLTDLPNRVLFNDRLTQAIAMARRHQRQLAVLYLDCVNFKDVNDSLGHRFGDPCCSHCKDGS